MSWALSHLYNIIMRNAPVTDMSRAPAMMGIFTSGGAQLEEVQKHGDNQIPFNQKEVNIESRSETAQPKEA